MAPRASCGSSSKTAAAPLAGREVPLARTSVGHRRADRRSAGRSVASWPTGRDRVDVALDGCRRDLAARLDLIPEGAWEFCWYTEPPLFDWSDEEERWVANHHPFTAPLHRRPGSDDGEGTRLRPRAERVRDRRGLDPDPRPRRAARRLRGAGSLPGGATGEVRAPAEGVPVRRAARTAGIAMGLDRLVMLLAGQGLAARRHGVPEGAVGRRPA